MLSGAILAVRGALKRAILILSTLALGLLLGDGGGASPAPSNPMLRLLRRDALVSRLLLGDSSASYADTEVVVAVIAASLLATLCCAAVQRRDTGCCASSALAD